MSSSMLSCAASSRAWRLRCRSRRRLHCGCRRLRLRCRRVRLLRCHIIRGRHHGLQRHRRLLRAASQKLSHKKMVYCSAALSVAWSSSSPASLQAASSRSTDSLRQTRGGISDGWSSEGGTHSRGGPPPFRERRNHHHRGLICYGGNNTVT